MEEPILKLYKTNDKLNEAYDILLEKINAISKQYKLTYFELFGLLGCLNVDLAKQNIIDEDKEEE